MLIDRKTIRFRRVGHRQRQRSGLGADPGGRPDILKDGG
jgi:hypothetical protein